MAKVVKVESKKASKWEPFITVTLSKREAAGLVAELGPYGGNVTPYDLYDDIVDSFDGELDGSPAIDHEQVNETSKKVESYLNKKYGKV